MTSVGSASSVGAFTVSGTADGQALQIRVGGSATGLTPASFAVGTTYDVTGVLTVFNASVQLKPRQAGDVVAQ